MKLIVGITEASGVAYGLRLLAYLKRTPEIEALVVMSDGATQKILKEMRWTPDMVDRLVGQAHGALHGTATVPTTPHVDGVIVAPCSVETLAAIVNAESKDLLAQATRVCLQQQGRVILLVTEPLFESEHLELMYRVSRMGAALLPCPAFRLDPVSVNDIVNNTVGMALDLVGAGRPESRLEPE